MRVQVNGYDVFVATGNRAPEAGKETIIFVHGSGQDHSIWMLPTRYFARHDRNVLAVDLPGHGRSGGPPLATVEAIADWLIEVLDTTGLDRAAIVGHSLGSLAAIAAAARNPRRVRTIVLVGITVPMPVSDFLLENAKEDRHEAIEMLNFWGISKSAQLGGNAMPGHWLPGHGRRLMEKAGPGVIFSDLKACNEYMDGLRHASAVECPALLLLGERDILTPAPAAKELTQVLLHAETVILKGSGHALLAERPDTVLDQLIRVV